MVEIIAECCQNHGGDRSLLTRMVAEAKLAGATHAKIQSIFADDLTYRPQFEQLMLDDSGNRISILRPHKAEYARLKGLEVSWADHMAFVETCHNNEIEPMTTIFTHNALLPVLECGFTSVKVASYDCASHALIRRIARFFNHIYVSTGACFDDEIAITAAILKGTDYSFLHCVTLYPLSPIEANLNRMKWLRNFTSRVGYSDHSNFAVDGLRTVLASIYMGATVVEVHFTMLPRSDTRDGVVSVNSEELKLIRQFANLSNEDQLSYLNSLYPSWDIALGSETRLLTSQELLNRSYYRGRFGSARNDYKGICHDTFIKNWELYDAE